jgi:hypothetical protein
MKARRSGAPESKRDGTVSTLVPWWAVIEADLGFAVSQRI